MVVRGELPKNKERTHAKACVAHKKVCIHAKACVTNNTKEKKNKQTKNKKRTNVKKQSEPQLKRHQKELTDLNKRVHKLDEALRQSSVMLNDILVSNADI